MQPNRYNTEQKKVTVVYMACIEEYAEPQIYTILEENQLDLKANYQYFIAELKANFNNPNICEEYIDRL